MTSCPLRGAVLILAAVVLSGCARDHEVVQAADAPIRVEADQMSVTVQNKAGLPLLDLNVSIDAAGSPPFTHLLTRLENGETHDISLSEFESVDGTTFNVRMMRPTAVRATAKDMTNKTYQVEIPWP